MLKELSPWFFPAVRPLRGATARCRTHPGAGCSQPGTAAGSAPGSSRGHLLYIAVPHPAVCSSTLATRGHAKQPGPGIIKNSCCFFPLPQSCCKHTLPTEAACIVARGATSAACWCPCTVPTVPPRWGLWWPRGARGQLATPCPTVLWPPPAAAALVCSHSTPGRSGEAHRRQALALPGSGCVWDNTQTGTTGDTGAVTPGIRRMPCMPAPWLGKTGCPQPSESSKTRPAEQHLCPAVLAPVVFSCPTWR